MSYLDPLDPDDSEQPQEPEEIDENTAEEDNFGPEEDAVPGEDTDLEEGQPELRGLEKAIDDLRKDLRTGPSEISDLTETHSITQYLEDAHAGDKAAEDRLWAKAMPRLEVVAQKALRGKSRLGWKPHDLIGEAFKKLSDRLREVKMENRRQFFGTACMHYKWCVLEALEKKNRELPSVSLEQGPTANDSDGLRDKNPADLKEYKDLWLHLNQALNDLPEGAKEIIFSLFNMGYGFRDLATTIDIPRSTLYDQYRAILQDLKKIIKPWY